MDSLFRSGWRPALMWQYLVVCLFDFMVAPTLSPFISFMLGIPYHEWRPLTLQGGGLYHVAMGAVGGVAVWTRSAEKKAIIDRGDDGDDGQDNQRRSPRAD